MAQALPKKTRESIIKKHNNGISKSVIAEHLDISIDAVYDIINLYNETGSIEPRPHNRGRKCKLCFEDMFNIKNAIKDEPDITILELIDKFSFDISESALSRIVKNKLGFVYKKNSGFRQRNRVKT